MRTAAALLLLAVLASPPAVARAGEEETAFLGGLRRSMAAVQTVQSSFAQERRLAMLREPLRSEGRLYYQAPDALRWEYTAPQAYGFSVQGPRCRRWEPAGAIREADLRRDPVLGPMAAELLAWVKFDLEHIQAAYSVEVLGTEPPVLRLRPRAQALRRVLDWLDIAFAPDGRSVLRVEYMEPDGDLTSIRFQDTALDGRLPDGLF